MIMEKILSIVIPAYNVEKYIEQCLKSFEKKAILDKIEVLIINDGSKDHTAQLAKTYCDKYPQTYYLFNKENGGHGSGINYGISHASGKYFKVVDGDDWVNIDELEAYVMLLERVDTDIVALDYLCIENQTNQILFKKYASSDSMQYGNAYEIDKGEIHSVLKMHAIAIKTSILKTNQIKIDEHCYYVDCEYITYPIANANSVYFYHKFIYMYRLGRNGQSMDMKSMQKNIAQHLKVINSLLCFYDQLHNISNNKKTYIEKCIAQVVENQFQIYISMGMKKGVEQELREFDLDLKNNYIKIYNSTNKKSITLLRKTNYKILKIGAVIYKIMKNNG